MPFSFRAVNASYLNAYAFPGGSIAVTRGLLLELEDEAELAALLGHELGHVNARHTADRMTKSALTGLMVTGLAAAAGRKDESYRDLALGLGGIGSGLLLAHYSRADERQADALGMEYAVKAGYSPGGMADLLSALMRESREQPSAIELMFATHPMSEERRQTALTAARGQYAAAAGLPDGRERYQAATARLRTLRPAIEAIRAGDRARAERNPEQAAERYGAALAAAPDDYEALLKLAKCRLAAGQSAEALRLAERARAAYPEEPQSLHVRGLARLQCNRFDSALSDFQEYERRLAGNPNTIFFQGRALEGMDRRGEAAAQYRRFLNAGGEGEYADYARRRLAEWTPPALRGT
jgi:predicted Zn-dependent protease